MFLLNYIPNKNYKKQKQDTQMRDDKKMRAFNLFIYMYVPATTINNYPT